MPSAALWVVLVLAAALVVAAGVILTLWGTGHLFHRTTVGVKSRAEALVAPTPPPTADTAPTGAAANAPLGHWQPTTRIQVETPHKMVELSAHGAQLVTHDERGHVWALQEDHSLTDLGPREGCVAVSKNGTVASVTALGYVNLGSGQTVVLQGFVAQRLQWSDENLWVAALDANQSGQLFCLDAAGQVVHTVAPQGGSQNQDHFAHSFHVNGAHLIAAHPLDQTAHVYSLGVPVCVIHPHVSSSHFPHAVAIGADGAWAFLTNPTQTLGSDVEAGSAMLFERDANGTFALKHEYHAAQPRTYGEFGGNLTTQRDWALLSGSLGDHRLYQRGQEVPVVVEGAKACLLSVSDNKVTVARADSEGGLCIQSFEPIPLTPS